MLKASLYFSKQDTHYKIHTNLKVNDTASAIFCHLMYIYIYIYGHIHTYVYMKANFYKYIEVYL